MSAAAVTTPCSRSRRERCSSAPNVGARWSTSSRPGPEPGPHSAQPDEGRTGENDRPAPRRVAVSSEIEGGAEVSRFVDRAVIHVAAGDGGHGCASVHREKFKPLGGPDGGNGGRGGDVVLVVDPNVHTLLDFHYRSHATAPSGRQGRGGHRSGATGEDLELQVPDGTVVLTPHGDVLADLVGPGTRFVVAAG